MSNTLICPSDKTILWAFNIYWQISSAKSTDKSWIVTERPAPLIVQSLKYQVIKKKSPIVTHLKISHTFI